MPSVYNVPGSFFTDTPLVLSQKMTFLNAEVNAERRAEGDYPYAVYRDVASIERLAAEYLDSYWELVTTEEYTWLREKWQSNASEIKRLFIPAFVAAYQKTVAKKDKETGRTVETLPTPATLSNIATLKGATLTLKDVDHNADECVYYLEVVDPNYIDGAYEEKWVLRLEGSTMPDTTTSTTASSFGVSSSTPPRISASGSAAYGTTNRTPQKPRKVIGSSFRKP